MSGSIYLVNKTGVLLKPISTMPTDDFIPSDTDLRFSYVDKIWNISRPNRGKEVIEWRNGTVGEINPTKEACAYEINILAPSVISMKEMIKHLELELGVKYSSPILQLPKLNNIWQRIGFLVNWILTGEVNNESQQVS